VSDLVLKVPAVASELPTVGDAMVRQETVLDTSAQQLANVYAKAFLGASEKAGQTDRLVEEFDSLIKDVLDRFPQFDSLLTTGKLTADNRIGIIDQVFGKRASPLVLSFLKVLAEHERLPHLRAIQRAIRDQYTALRQRVRVEISTAAPLEDGQLGKLTGSLRNMLGAEPEVHHSVNPDLIGGLVVRIGDTVYDGSVLTQLNRLREQIIDRSVHEIQSRRDRFRNPAAD
jgi:F-type H+-transporting ATPase subunit delta